MAEEGKQWSLPRIWIEEAPLRAEATDEKDRSSFLQESIVYVEGKGSMEKDDGNSDAVEAC
ncbi:hypothetical protein Goshw_018920 [Gossypium schwendimanii]|uniref:Uncharacterized protein n=1 Tax=Gossypium schwendimanii TaxID=34291 RepID=A0A7J9KMA0_GOSSC|nr:hypothetical protein [Gossypium schwendimanii]